MKSILILMIATAILQAEGFESFLKKAIQNSDYIKSLDVEITKERESGKILTRYKNPTVELEASLFDSTNQNSRLGYRAACAQPILRWGVQNKKEALALSNVNVAKADNALKKAIFVRDISIQFTKYAHKDLLMQLALEELMIAKKIFSISEKRYAAKTISKDKLLQAKIDLYNVQSRVELLKIEKDNSYYTLLKQAGFNKEVKLSSDYTFALRTSSDKNAQLALLKRKQERTSADLNVKKNSFEWFNIATEIEDEPDQNIVRFNLSIPLTLFNNKSQERTVAKLQTEQISLAVKQHEKVIEITQKQLLKEANNYYTLQLIDQKTLQEEETLLALLEEGYRIAKTNLLTLQNLKARLIETKERLINTKIALDQNTIMQNYLQGYDYE